MSNVWIAEWKNIFVIYDYEKLENNNMKWLFLSNNYLICSMHIIDMLCENCAKLYVSNEHNIRRWNNRKRFKPNVTMPNWRIIVKKGVQRVEHVEHTHKKSLHLLQILREIVAVVACYCISSCCQLLFSSRSDVGFKSNDT